MVRSDDDHFLKNFGKMHKFSSLGSRVSVSNFKSRVSVSKFLMKSRSRLEILTRSRSRRLRSRLHHWPTHRVNLLGNWHDRYVTDLKYDP